MTDGPHGPWSPPPQNPPPGSQPGPGQWGPPSVYGSPSQPGPPHQPGAYGPPPGHHGPPPGHHGPPPGHHGPPPGHHGPPGAASPYGPPGSWGNYGNLPYVPPKVKRTQRSKLLSMLVVGLLVVGAAIAGVSRVTTPSNQPVDCQPHCNHPPTVMPISSRPVYVGANKSFTVRYDANSALIKSHTSSSGVTETLEQADGGVIKLFGLAASGRSAEQVTHDVVQQPFPDAKRAYAVPNAIVGYQPGYGEVDDVYPQSSGGTATHDRLIVMVAIKNNVALVGEAFGPYDPSKPDGVNNDGHASGASLLIATFFLDPLVNSFSWQGDPAR